MGLGSDIQQRLMQAQQNTQQPTEPGGLPDIFNPDFEDRVNALIEAVKQNGGQAGVFSGPRSSARQEQMYLSALDKYGDESLAKKYISPPGESLHEAVAGQKYGLGPGALAADLNGDLQSIYEMAPKFGLEFANKQQPWHIQYAGLTSLK